MNRIAVGKGVKVGAHIYKVRTGQHITDRLKEGSFYGRTYHSEEKLIMLDSKLPETQFSQTFLHEVIHAVDTIYLGSSLREKQVIGIANGLAQVMEGLGVRFIK